VEWQWRNHPVFHNAEIVVLLLLNISFSTCSKFSEKGVYVACNRSCSSTSRTYSYPDPSGMHRLWIKHTIIDLMYGHHTKYTVILNIIYGHHLAKIWSRFIA
jgi:hypothetical protein